MNERNMRRWRALNISRSVKSVFRPGGAALPGKRVVGAIALFGVFLLGGPNAWRRWLYRSVFTVDGETLRLAANHVLADLRDFSFARTSAFDPDPIIMARRQGRRDVWLRIANYLELDETAVQKLMEIDDGI